MKGFLDSLKQGGGGDKNKKNPASNLLTGLGLAQQPKRFQGGGQSLGGSLPGVVIPVELKEEGPLGVKVERRSNSQGTAIVSMVVDGGQADRAGLKRGDIVCFHGSNGQEEMMFDMFIELAKSNQRPLCFEVRRIQQVKNKNQQQQVTAADRDPKSSAEAYNRKQAMIAAAEARDKAHKKKTAPSNAAKKALKQKASSSSASGANANNSTAADDHHAEPKSELSRAAAEAAKLSEARTAAELGYNPYETNRVTAGQARNATVAVAHGTIRHQDSTGGGGSSSQQQAAAAASPAAAPQQVRPPQDALVAEDLDAAVVDMDPHFEQAYETLITGNPDHVTKSSLVILQKLLVNATTKAEDKFKRVRLGNEKIKAAVVDVEGALELLMSAGFELTTEDSTQESVLVYPPGRDAPAWLPRALKQMEGYAKS